MWVFISENLIGYRFSLDRSQKTPEDILGGSNGVLVADAFSGYNSITNTDGRTRAGCLAHARRKIYEAREADQTADKAIEMIGKVYRAEHDAKEQGVAQTESHLELRKKRAAPAMKEFNSWLNAAKEKHAPKSAMGKAINYALRHWTELTRFLEDARIPVDNNRSEAALRVVALGRKNFLFVGNETAGKNLAGIYSLIATCDACGVNPLHYLPDVMRRISTHPARKIDELLPDLWKQAQ
jgi:transposase